jgi:putative phage-type endonuclease
VLGISPWRSTFRLWSEKIGAEAVPDLALTEWIYWGTVHEPTVAAEFERRTQIKVRVEKKFLTHKKYPFIGGHIDRRIIGQKKRSFLECKTSNAFDYRQWGDPELGIESVPPHYVAQADHYMMVMDCDGYCYLAVLIGGNIFRCYKIERNEKREAELLAAELEFWDLVQTRSPPPVHTEADAKLRWKYALEGSAIAVDAGVKNKVATLSRICETRKKAEKQEKTLRDELYPLFQDRERLTFNGETIAHLTCFSQKRIDTDLLKAKHPQIAKRLIKDIPVKRLSIDI